MKKYGGFSLLLWPLVGMVLFAVLFFIKQSGMQYSIQSSQMAFVPDDIMHAAKPEIKKECIILYDSHESYSQDIFKNISFVLSSMSINYDEVDLSSHQFPKLSLYKTAIMSFANITTIHKFLPDLFSWVKLGGRLAFAVSIEPSSDLTDISSTLGLVQSATEFAVVNKVRIVSDFMLGGKGNEYTWGDNNRYSLIGQLDGDCTVHIVSVGDTEIPLLWEKAYGKGKILVNNNDALCQKQSRGLVAAIYSQLDDICVYPVINASMIYIDDFPAPISDGYNEWIYKYYKMSIDSFYTNIWFPSILEMGKKYGLKYTGMLLETYDDNTTSPFTATKDTDRLKYLGDLLLDNKHEIGLHGYNHQPLVLESYDYPKTISYKKWKSIENMGNATGEAIRFSKELFPKLAIKTYIPPSFILSNEGRKMLKERFPQINVISGSYMAIQNDLTGSQEFDVGSDGIIDVPQLISGDRFYDDSRWLALNEINYHYVNSLSLNPNDMLTSEYGADGWENVQQNLQQYLTWVFDSAKGIRNLTAQESAKSVQRYCNLRIEKIIDGSKMNINLWGFYDEAWLIMRCSVGKPVLEKGGTILPLQGNLYLLHATSKNLELKIER